MKPAATITAFDRFGLTLFVAVTLHTVVVLGISFTIEKPKKQPPPDRTLEIMVVQNPKKAEQPEKADFLAQTSQQGGGEAEERVRPTTLPTPPAVKSGAAPAMESLPSAPTRPTPPDSSRKVLTRQAPAKKQIRKKPVTPLPKRRRATAAQLIASTNIEITRLTAEIDRKRKAYAKRPRRKKLTASTQEYKYASYMEAWRRKVERIGNANYPDEARRNRLFGNLLLHVAVRKDGTIREINIKRSSGHKLLDDAAIRIVRLSAPFAPFPAEISKETDVVDIIRTWQFQRSNQLIAR